MFSSIRKEVKTKDVVPLKAKKALLKGITAVTRILDDFMKDGKSAINLSLLLQNYENNF